MAWTDYSISRDEVAALVEVTMYARICDDPEIQRAILDRYAGEVLPQRVRYPTHAVHRQ